MQELCRMVSEMKKHWETVYLTKQPNEVGWTQEIPETSLAFIRNFGLPRSAKIIDVGGGDSKLVDHLLKEGYENITVLDISINAIQRAKLRLGADAEKVSWIVCDITKFEPDTTYDLWHDRALCHFLITKEKQSSYVKTANKSVSKHLVISTFSETGPKMCSGLIIRQYSADSLKEMFSEKFELIQSKTEDHITSSGNKQNFLFCSFSKRK